MSDLGTKITEAYLVIASSETVWTTFESEVITPASDDFKSLVEQMRKRYCTLYSAHVNRQTRRYFRSIARSAATSSSEPADIHPEFLKIC